MTDKRFGPEEFAAYIAAFNRDDFADYGRFYAVDIRMQFNGKVSLDGREAVRRFYERMHRRLHQTIRIIETAGDRSVLFANIEGEFLALEDFPDFSAGALARGERMFSRSLARYQLEDGLITSVIAARYAMEFTASADSLE